ncbi:MAG: hypothetical protein Q7U89_05560 [Coriobacteriia bacterium]|nr:hypothetical protein [Coriobacteriia bacterium]
MTKNWKWEYFPYADAVTITPPTNAERPAWTDTAVGGCDDDWPQSTSVLLDLDDRGRIWLVDITDVSNLAPSHSFSEQADMSVIPARDGVIVVLPLFPWAAVSDSAAMSSAPYSYEPGLGDIRVLRNDGNQVVALAFDFKRLL